MGIYTAYDLDSVDALIEMHMQILRDLCCAHLGSNFESLVLSGSFGRGEGSVLIHADGAIEPLRDYDTRVILQRPSDPCVIERIRAEFMHATGLGRADERFSGEQGFSLTLEPLTRDELVSVFVRDRDLRVYDHLNASRVIAGPDHAPALRFPATEIPKANGMRLLYKKMVGLVGHFAGPEIVADVRRTLLYECDKTFVEICTALVLLAGAYLPSYRERASLFARHWRTWFPELAQRLPDLDVQIGRATQEKLFPGSTPPLPPYESFIRARDALLEVHRYYASSLYGIDVVPGPIGCALMRRTLKKDYFRVAVAEWLGQRRLDCAPARWALNNAYHYLLRRRFARGVGQRGAGMIWQTVRTGEGPPLDIFLAAWCALAATGDTPDSALLRCADQALGRLPGMTELAHAPSGWEGYQATRERIVQAYSTWEHHR